jgi:4,5-dihydroxyphthalate decarboxylase
VSGGDLRLKLACWDYDRTRPIIDGRARPAGIDLSIEVLRPRQMFPRMLEHREFDASELSLASLAGLVGRGASPFIGAPVMLSRFFRHSCIYTRRGAGIREPRDLVGKRVGATQFAATATVFMKGMLADEYGVRQSDMEWFIGGLDKPTETPLIPLATPPGVKLTFLGTGETLEKMLAEDRLDALLSIYIPPSFLARSPRIARLFPNYREVEADYYRRTRIFPIMHTLAMRRDVHDAHPWAAKSLYDAFVAARDLALGGLYDTDALRLGLPWLLDHVEELWSVFGEDWWAYGVEANRPTLSALGRYVFEQGLSPRIVTPDEMFVPGLG